MALNQINTMVLPNGKEVAFVDWTDQPLFSTCEIEHGATRQEISLFQYTVGDSVPAASATTVVPRTATEKDTNMAAPGAMASTEEMLVYAIKPEYFTLVNAVAGTFDDSVPQNATGQPVVTPTQVAILQEALLLTLEISQKRYAHAGLGYFNTGFGAVGSASSGLTLGAGGRTYGGAGLATQEAVRSFVVPHYIGGQEKFRVTLSNPSGKALNIGNAEQGAQVNATGTSAGAATTDMIVRIRIYLDGLHKRPTA